MCWLTRVLLVSTLATAIATNLPAQRSSGRGGSGPLPSATALGAGALNSGPSATARSTGPARGFITSRGTIVRSGGFNRSRGIYGRSYGRLPLAYWLTPYYFPFDYGNSYGGTDYGMTDDPNADAAMMAQNALIDQVQRLSAQVAQLENGSQQRPPMDMMQQEPQAPPPVPVTLVLRDGQQLQVQNYAVMDQTFWDFTRQPVRKIPISSIDIAASAKATEAKGGEFPQMASP